MGYNLVPEPPARTRGFIVLCSCFYNSIDERIQSEYTNPRCRLGELFVRMIDEEIHIGLPSGGQNDLASDPIAQFQNGLAEVGGGGDEAGGEGDESSLILNLFRQFLLVGLNVRDKHSNITEGDVAEMYISRLNIFINCLFQIQLLANILLSATACGVLSFIVSFPSLI